MGKIDISKDKLVKVLKLLYSLWNKSHPDHWPSHYHIEWGAGSPYDFYKRNHKVIGLPMSVDEYFFWMNALELNEDNLEKRELSVDNVVVPEYKKFEVNAKADRIYNAVVRYTAEIEGYFTERQLDLDFWTLMGLVIDYDDFEEDDVELGSISGEDNMEITSIEEIDSDINESKVNHFDKFIDSLTESELKFFQQVITKKLLK